MHHEYQCIGICLYKVHHKASVSHSANSQIHISPTAANHCSVATHTQKKSRPSSLRHHQRRRAAAAAAQARSGQPRPRLRPTARRCAARLNPAQEGRSPAAASAQKTRPRGRCDPRGTPAQAGHNGGCAAGGPSPPSWGPAPTRRPPQDLPMRLDWQLPAALACPAVHSHCLRRCRCSPARLHYFCFAMRLLWMSRNCCRQHLQSC